VQTHEVKKTDFLALGTAQFGLDYGISNTSGMPDAGHVQDILNVAKENGVNTLDTAAAYGKSETVLGACNLDKLSIITKFPSLADVRDEDLYNKIKASVFRSLDRLKIDHLYGVLAHDSRDMIGERGRQAFAALAELREEGLIGRIGTSVYNLEEMNELSPFCTKIIQAPFNIFDQRFISQASIRKLKQNNSRLYVRSIFLQGLLLMSPEKRPSYFIPWEKLFTSYDKSVRQSGLNHVAFCLRHAASHGIIEKCVVGVTNLSELNQILSAFTSSLEQKIDTSEFKSTERSLIDPRQWKL